MRSKIYLKKMQHTLLLALLLTAVLSVFGVPRAYAKAETDDLSVLEERCLVPVAVLTEMTDGAFTFVSVKDLRGTDGAVGWFVVEGDPGYAVVAEDGTIAELSAEAVSPYDGLSGDRLYYFGDGAYYVWENGAFLHIATGQTLSLADAEATLGVGLDDSVAVQSADDGVTYVTELTFPGVSFDTFIKVPDYQLLYNKRTAWEFGYNRYGTCTGVAANIFLQYYSEIKCPGVLPYENFPQLRNPDVYVPRLETSVSLDYGDTDSVGERQHKYIYNRIENSDSNVIVGAGMWACKTGLQTVIDESNKGWNANAVSLEGGDETSFMQSNRKSLLIEKLCNGYLVMGFIFMDRDDKTGVITKSEKHACVFYGYQIHGGKRYFLAHLGYETIEFGDTVTQDPYAAIISEDYLQDGFIYVDAPSATHSLTLLRTSDGGHQYKCLYCGYQKEEHPLKIDSHDSSFHVIVCDYCNYSRTEAHTTKYTNLNSVYHLIECSKCSYFLRDTHLYVHDNKTGKGVCVCGRVAGIKDPIIIEKKPEEAS